MWPLVQSGDACWFHPIQAVTAKCKRLYTHIVHEVQRRYIQRLRAAMLKKLKQQG